MLAIIEQDKQGSYVDNTTQFLILILAKVCLDFGAMYLCYLKPLLSFFNMCSLSIILVDLILAMFMSVTLWLDVHTSHTVLCFIMAHFSAAYSAVPIPMLCLGILDYGLQVTQTTKKCLNLVKTIILVLLLWSIAGIYAYATVDATLLEQERDGRYLVCEIQESKVVTYSVIVMFNLMFFVLLPYWSLIPQWVKEADQISEAREKTVKTKTSDLVKITTVTPEEEIKCTKEDSAKPRPSMHISLLLGFGVIWIPYLSVSTVCSLFEFGIPAYISVNLLWVQCINSVLAGTVFWLRSNTVGPYSNLPDSVCLWQVYWHLSRGSEAHQQLLTNSV